MTYNFAVSAVDPNTCAPDTHSMRASIEQILDTPVESCSTPEEEVIEPYGFNLLVETIHRCYDEHRSLILTPDNIWLTIVQGLAKCVNQDPEHFRKFFVSHEGKEEIRIRRDEFAMGDASNDWQNCFPEFSQRILEYIGEQTHGLIVSDFSTTNALARAASEVVLMDVVQAYFEYVVETRCGIPSITLEGTAEDWASIANRTRQLAKFEGLEWWLDGVYEVVDNFAAAARGEVDLEWWQNLYKGEEGSGSIDADGNILKLIPYINCNDRVVKNPIVTQQACYGIDTSTLPQALSCVPFVWDYYGQPYDYQFLAGHVAIAYDKDANALRPVLGWAVRSKPE